MSDNLLNGDDLHFYADQLRRNADHLSADHLIPLVDQIAKTFVETGEAVQSTVRSFVIRPDPVPVGTIEVDYDGTCNRIVAAGEKENTIAVVTQPKPKPRVVMQLKTKKKKGLFGSSWRKSKSVAPAEC
jgi:hypothetical protein